MSSGVDMLVLVTQVWGIPTQNDQAHCSYSIMPLLQVFMSHNSHSLHPDPWAQWSLL